MADRVVPRGLDRITQEYKKGVHDAVDIGWTKSEEENVIFANCEGVVVELRDGLDNDVNVSGSDRWGNYVYVKHNNGMFSRYAHLKKGLFVKFGDEVDGETILGVMGDSGRAFGRHLHFEVSNGYLAKDRIDPTPYLMEKINNYENKDFYKGELPKISFIGSISRWQRGINVKKLQMLINWINDCDLKVDGFFGKNTLEQVKVFQNNYNLKVNGKFDKKALEVAKKVMK